LDLVVALYLHLKAYFAVVVSVNVILVIAKINEKCLEFIRGIPGLSSSGSFVPNVKHFIHPTNTVLEIVP
jgi:hypothetical protein